MLTDWSSIYLVCLSLSQVITRLEPIIFELERQEEPLLIVAHQAVLRCLYAYFLDLSTEELPYLSIPLNTLIRLEPKAYGCKEKRIKFDDNNLDASGHGQGNGDAHTDDGL
jgi:broad specificity phosphatase PhoE